MALSVGISDEGIYRHCICLVSLSTEMGEASYLLGLSVKRL
jgi:hypothetical protein